MSEEYSESGQPIYRHQKSKRAFEDASVDAEAVEKIEAHVDHYIGKIARVFHEIASHLVHRVFHEIASHLVHIDIHIIEPTPERDFFSLITTGMSDRPMSVPAGAEEWRYAEVMLCLPSSWQLSSEALKQEEHYWPLRWLKTIARLPHEYNTWIGEGHTMPNGDPARPFAANTALCGVLVSCPILFEQQFWQLSVRDGKTVHFYSLIPLYQEELDLKLTHGVDSLYERFDDAEVSELLDIQRFNVGRQI